MIGRIIKQIICAAIESFPISEAKKAEMLREIIEKGKTTEVENDVLR